MKITAEHYTELKALIVSVINDMGAEGIAEYRRRLQLDPRVGNLEMRFRWDLLWKINTESNVLGRIYTYANDDHIDTALRSVMKELNDENILVLTKELS